jgi:hypothetical protein
MQALLPRNKIPPDAFKDVNPEELYVKFTENGTLK